MSSKIGVDDALVVLQFLRYTAGQHAAIGKAVYSRSQVHDHTHIMLDHAQGDS